MVAVALAAMVVVGAGGAALASAETSLLPEGTEANPVEFTYSSGAGELTTLNGSFSIKCTTDSGKGKITSATLGTFEGELTGCTTLGGTTKCSTLEHADSTGKLLVMGEIHLRMGLAGQPLGIITFLILHVHVLCGLVLELFLGCFAGEVTSSLNALISSMVVSLKTKEAGLNEITSTDNAAETGMEECALKIKKGSETEETQGALETTETVTSFKQGGASVTALVHV